jgi:hypothetical protein
MTAVRPPWRAVHRLHSGRAFHSGTITALRGKLKECKVSARAEARSIANVGQSVGLQPYRVGNLGSLRKSSVAF